MRLLILGGTVFLGRHLVEAAQARGHTLTLFNRGKSRPEAFPMVEQVHGDRVADLALHALAPHYTFISSEPASNPPTRLNCWQNGDNKTKSCWWLVVGCWE